MKHEIKHYKSSYHSQKYGAKKRGIGFLFTFEEWMDFWGEDVDRRGCRPLDLQMQRISDIGPYAVGNVRKGTPKQNSATYSAMYRKRACEKAAAELQARWDAMMDEPSAPDTDKPTHEECQANKFKIKSVYDLRTHQA